MTTLNKRRLVILENSVSLNLFLFIVVVTLLSQN